MDTATLSRDEGERSVEGGQGRELSSATAPPAPDRIMQIASGFMAAKHLFAASELGLFESLDDGGATLPELAARMGVSERTARISADAMVALGLVARDGDRYRNGDVAAAFLAGRGPADLRPMMRFWDRLSYRNWSGLAQGLRTGRAAGGVLSALTPEEGEIFAAGVEAVTMGPAMALAGSYPFDRHERLLDVGGGTGSFLLAALGRHRALRGTLVEIPPVVEVARARAAGSPFADRIEVLDADALTGPLPADHDAILVANVAHIFSPETNRRLLRRLRDVAPDNARLLLVDFWTDPGHTQPPIAPLMAGEFLLVSDEGDVYSEAEVGDWLAATGWRALEHRALAGPQSLIVAEATG